MKRVSDEIIGQRFGPEGQIEVIARNEKLPGAHDFKYTLLCHICKQDPEMYGDGTFLQFRSDLLNGKLACGCSKIPKFTKEQWKIRIERKAAEQNYEVVAIADWVGQNTKVTLHCNKCDKNWDTCSVSNFLRDRKCPYCAATARPDNRQLSQEDSQELFMSTGKFAEGTVFSRVNTRGRMWQYTCPICSNDEYVKAGLCSGIFTSDRGNFRVGKLSCRCSVGCRWTQEQREYQIKKIILENELGHTFIGWKTDGKYGQKDKFVLEAADGTRFEKSIGNFIDRGCWRTPDRDIDPLRASVVYVLQITGKTTDFTGYGITTKWKYRLMEHTKNLKDKGFRVSEYTTFPMTWEQASSVESKIKWNFETYSQEVIGFKREATFPHLYQDVINFVKEQLDTSQNPAYNKEQTKEN